ncbi:MAG TPA: sigma-54 dependent transcriptional regulator [Planctomicrobium sp.]|nr:sigma-54 dependent transcriptional regulator [Planctomicrobium sp.]
MGKLLVIDDERNVSFSIADVFTDSEIEVRSVVNGEQGLQLVNEWAPDVILLDLRLGQESGLEVFHQIRQIDAKALVIFMTGFGTSEVAIEAMKHGAFDYIVKPLDVNHLRELVRQGCQIRRLVQVPAFVAEAEYPETRPQQIIGNGKSMREVCKSIGRIAPQSVNVLILGESGTGKELVARAIYHHSRRSSQPFLAINCAAIPDSLLESELFGHEKGAFTGATQRRIGKFEQCHGGTLLLDEIGDMPPATQAKMLRLLQEGTFERVGGNETLHCDVRIIAATNQDLDARIQNNSFRRDLFYRLCGVSIMLPPLRDRREDIPQLAHHFLFQYGAEIGSSVQTISPEALELLTNYSWPGNIRELQNVIRSALIASTGMVLLPSFLPVDILSEENSLPDEPLTDVAEDVASWQSMPHLLDRWLTEGEHDLYRRALEKFDRFVIGRVMRFTSGNQLRASELLGLSRVTIRNRLRTFVTQDNVDH